MSKKALVSNFNAMEDNDTMTYDTQEISKDFKIYFQT